MAYNSNGRAHLQEQLAVFLAEYRRKYGTKTRPGAGNFISWRLDRPPELKDDQGNEFLMVWPRFMIQEELKLALPSR